MELSIFYQGVDVRHGHKEVSSGSEAMAIPLEGLASGADLKRILRGLTAVGVSLGEALAPYAMGLGMLEMIRISKELAPDGVEWMRALAAAQTAFEDKAAFGRACMDEGLHPACVAFGVISYFESGFPRKESLDECRHLLNKYRVDPWLASRVDSVLEFEPKDLFRLTRPLSIIPCRLDLRQLHDADLSRIEEVGDYLDLEDVHGLQLDGLKWVHGNLDLSGAQQCSFGSLEGVRGTVWLTQDCDLLSFPKLRTVGTLLYDESLDVKTFFPVLADGMGEEGPR